MKTEDFERLKKLCNENGFELVTESPKDNDKFFVVKKKDEWEGVEFAECIQSTSPCFISGKIYLVDLNKIQVDYRKYFKPSTEQAYVEQLKKEAFEKFGEIKEGDRFDSSCFYGDKTIPSEIDTCEFYYNKKHDLLFVGMVCLYDKGKWAERVKERVFVSHELQNHFCDSLIIKFSTGYVEKPNDVASFLSKQLEKYLNNEIE